MVTAEGFERGVHPKRKTLSASWLTCFVLAALVVLSGSQAGGQAPAPAAGGQNAPSAPAATPAPASSTDIVGVWQGTLHIAQANRDLRIEIRIAKGSDGSYKTTFYSIDQGGRPLAATKTTLENGTVTFTMEMIGGKYEGKMSPDGKTITGTWSQGPNPLPLVLERTTEDAAWPIPEPPKPMAANADPGFDVATVKPTKPGSQGKGIGFDGQKFIANHFDMNDLIAFAYGLHAKQIIGAPDWFATDLYDVAGTPDVSGQPSLHQMELMMQKLLPDRFALKFHHEQRELPVYIITVAPGGPKMKVTKLGPNDPQPFFFRGLGDLVVGNMTIKEVATWFQSSVMDRPVVDHTGLTDRYDFTLKWTPDDSQFAQFRSVLPPTASAAGDNPNAPPSLYTAMPEQLGLKIEAGKAMDDVIVIDHVEKPSAN